MAVKHQIAVNAGVIDFDYTGEIKVVLANMGNQDYQVKNGDRIAPLIREKIVESDCYEVRTLKKNQQRTTRILKHRNLQGTDLRDQCQSLWNVLPKTGHDHRNP